VRNLKSTDPRPKAKRKGGMEEGKKKVPNKNNGSSSFRGLRKVQETG